MPLQTSDIENLLLSDFLASANSGVAGVLQTVLQHTVFRGETRTLIRHPGRLTFGTKDLFSGNGALVTFNLTKKAVVSANHPTPARAFVGGVEQAYVAAAPGAGQFTVNFAVSPATITFGVAPGAGADNVDVRYANAEGNYSIEVFTPNSRRHDTYKNGTIRRLNSAPQHDNNNIFAIDRDTPPLTQDHIIRIQVDSAAVVDLDAEKSYTSIELPFVRGPLLPGDAETAEAAPAVLGM